jgi:hypothetical protein
VQPQVQTVLKGFVAGAATGTANSRCLLLVLLIRVVIATAERNRRILNADCALLKIV